MSTDPLPRVFLLPGRDKRLRGGHPWVYSNEVRLDDESKALAPGAVVSLHRTDGKPLGVGTFNAHCLIAFRLFSTAPNTTLDSAFIEARLGRALALRQRLYDAPFYRLVHGEADGLPGLVVDRFGDTLVVQTATAGTDALLPVILAALDAVVGPTAVVLRNDGAFRRLESLSETVAVVSGEVAPPIEIKQDGLIFVADPVGGQKTGWFFDQRPNRAAVAALVRDKESVLDAYCHSGAFAIAAAAQGASEVVGVDRSDPALDLARQTAERNGVAERCEFVRGDAFDELEKLAAVGRRFDVVFADPPAFAKSRRDMKSGLKGYRKLARLAAPLVRAGGLLALSSCSHNVDGEAFSREVATGIARSDRGARILRTGGAGPDHPVHPFLPESAYLKSLLMQLD